MEVIGVLLNCSDWFDEAARLMDTGFERYEMFTAFEKGECVRVLPVHNGTQETVCIQTAEKLTCVVPRGAYAVLEIDLPDEAEAGMICGETVGEARLLLGEEVMARTALVAAQTLAERDYVYELQRVVNGWPVMPQRMAK